ncbi:MAG: LysR family transcriptional regulator [Cyanobacteria bacterium P01_D01_bin.105]
MPKDAYKPLKISQLTALVAVAEEGGFSAAGLQLGVAQSTVSHAIATLESDLGVVLLLRNRSGAVLTPIGNQIYQQARSVLNMLKDIQQTAAQAKDLQTGKVRLAAVRTVATHILPGVISQFRHMHPHLTVELAECDRYWDVERVLREGEADIGFTLLPTPEGFQSWELFREDFVALLPPKETPPKESLPIEDISKNISAKEKNQNQQQTIENAEGTPLSWDELLKYPRIANTRSKQHNVLVQEHLARFGHPFPVDFEVREDSTLMGMVKKGLGAAVLARLEAEPVPPEVRLYSLPEPLERVVGAAILENAVLPRAVFVFLDVLRSLPVPSASAFNSI